MKKIISILAISVVLFSCKKEKTTAPPANAETGLEAYFKFTSSFNDETGKATAVPSGTASFTADRNGNGNSALKLDGGSKVTMSNIFQKDQSSSISAWIALDDLSGSLKYFVTCTGNGLAFNQGNATVGGAAIVPNTVTAYTNCADNNWHHYVVTYDGTDVRLYRDGVLAETKNNPGSIVNGNNGFVLGYWNNTYWKGRIDDLRFYSKVLSAEEVTKLAKE